MASFEKRVNDDGSTGYRVKVRLRGHEPVSATFQRLTDAKTWAAQTETELKANRYFGAAKRHTVAEVIDRYQADARPRLKSSRDVKQRLESWRGRVGHLWRLPAKRRARPEVSLVLVAYAAVPPFA